MIEITDITILNQLLYLCKTRNQWVNHLINLQRQKTEYMNLINKKIFCFGPVWCFTWRIAVLIMIVILEIFHSYNIKTNPDVGSRMASFMIIFILSLSFIGMAIWTIYKASTSISHKYKVKRAKSSIIVLNNNINDILNKINQISKQISEYNYLPEVYWFAGDMIINYILNRRADNLKEAINLFEYERRMNFQFNRQMQALQNINNLIRNNRKSNAAGNAVIAGAAIAAGFISKL